MSEIKELIKYIKSLGIKVNTSTKARGHSGFYLKNRIDISKNVPESKKIRTLVHEFAHYIHSKLESDIEKTGGSLEVLFKSSNPIIKSELMIVTNFVDHNSMLTKLENHKLILKQQIKRYEDIIKLVYPDFKRSKSFKEFDKYIKNSDAKYLLKYDRVKLVKGLWKKQIKIYSIDNLDIDFKNMPEAFSAYIRLRSCQRRKARISSRINSRKKYYSKPAELFARFVEGIYLDKSKTEMLAPNATKIFYECLAENHYQELSILFHKYLHIL